MWPSIAFDRQRSTAHGTSCLRTGIADDANRAFGQPGRQAINRCCRVEDYFAHLRRLREDVADDGRASTGEPDRFMARLSVQPALRRQREVEALGRFREG